MGSGVDLFRAVCERDLEGIVAKRADARYGVEGTWIKIKSRAYSQNYRAAVSSFKAEGRSGSLIPSSPLAPRLCGVGLLPVFADRSHID